MYQFAEANPYSEITIQIMRKKRCCHPSQKIKILESEIQKTSKKKKAKNSDLHNSNLLNDIVDYHKVLAMKPIKKVVETKKMKIKKPPDKNKNRDSNRNNTNITVRKQNDNKHLNRIKKK